MAGDTTKKDLQKKAQDSDLPLWESVVTVGVWCAGAFYMCYTVAEFSQERIKYLHADNFEPGWNFTGRMKDMSNFEWDYWTFWNQRTWHWYLIHVIISQLLRWKFFEYRYIFNILYSLGILIAFLGWKSTLLMYGHLAIMYLAAWTGSLLVVWIAAMALLSTLNISAAVDWMREISIYDPYFQTSFLLLIFALSMCNLRYISFCCEWCQYRKRLAKEVESADLQQKNNTHVEKLEFSFIRMVHYCTYLPMCFTGPVFTYNQFYAHYWQPVKPWTRQTVIVIIKQVARVLFAYCVCELMLTYMYFNAIQMTPEIETMPMWPLGGTGYLHGQFFMVKYVVLYGVPRILCMLDQIVIPQTPSCISRIGSSVQYWRTFDRGLHQFMIRNIYVPLGGSKSGVLWQLVASTACFIFVYIWHGAGDNLFYWVLSNYIDIVLETIAALLYSFPKVQELEKKYLSRANSRRLKGLLKTPSFLLTVVGVFTFLGGTHVGKTFIHRFFYEGSPMRLVVAFILGYCLVQTDYIVTVIEKNRAIKQKLQ